MSEPPVISVVLAASDSPEAVARSLATLPRDEGVEIIVAAPAGWDVDAPGAVVVVGSPGDPVPRLRRLGLDRARGDMVVFTEDSCAFAPGWLDGWRRAFETPSTLAAGGPVLAAMGDRRVDRAVFSCEYAPFAPVVGGEETYPGRLPGNNFAVRRGLAGRLDPDRIDENAVERLAGPAVGWSAGALALHVRRYGMAEALRDRLRFGHDFGRSRMADRRWPWRGAGLVVGPLILLSQVVRLVRVVARRRRDLGAFAESFPITVALLTAWSAGEWLGWVRSAFAPRSASRR